MTLDIKCFYSEYRLGWVPQYILYAECHYAEFHYAKCHSAKFHYAKYHYTKCHYAKCHLAECGGTMRHTIELKGNQPAAVFKHTWNLLTGLVGRKNVNLNFLIYPVFQMLTDIFVPFVYQKLSLKT